METMNELFRFVKNRKGMFIRISLLMIFTYNLLIHIDPYLTAVVLALIGLPIIILWSFDRDRNIEKSKTSLTKVITQRYLLEGLKTISAKYIIEFRVADEKQRVFKIPIKYFSKTTDSVNLFINTIYIFPHEYELEDPIGADDYGYIVLKENWRACVDIRIEVRRYEAWDENAKGYEYKELEINHNDI